jgi:hypothetical protein
LAYDRAPWRRRSAALAGITHGFECSSFWHASDQPRTASSFADGLSTRPFRSVKLVWLPRVTELPALEATGSRSRCRPAHRALIVPWDLLFRTEHLHRVCAISYCNLRTTHRLSSLNRSEGGGANMLERCCTGRLDGFHRPADSNRYERSPGRTCASQPNGTPSAWRHFGKARHSYEPDTGH